MRLHFRRSQIPGDAGLRYALLRTAVRTATGAAATCALATALLAIPGASLGADATSPLLLKAGVGLWEQYGYDPLYTRNVPSFDPDGTIYIRHRAADPDLSRFVQTPAASGWARLDFTDALAAAFPTFAGNATRYW